MLNLERADSMKSLTYDGLTEFYEDVKLFIRRLREAGLDQLAYSVEAAMAGSTSGEILTHIAYLPSRAREEGPELPSNLAAQRDAILEWADAALRTVGQRYRPSSPRA
jgi:hypothetical protein